MRFVMIAIYLILLMPITGSWWAVGSNILLDPTQVCKKTRRLNTKLSKICRNDTSLLREITKGINMGFRECENQFRNRKWNCSALKKSMRRILNADTRETAFVNAITAAGVTYAVTKACTMGDLVECSCDKKHQYNNNNNMNTLNIDNFNNNNINNSNNNRKRKSNNDNDIIKNKMNNNNKKKKNNMKKNKDLVPDGNWKWGGCDDNVNFGFKKSKEFLDGKLRKGRRGSDIKTVVKLHNNDAGRLAVKRNMKRECKCHGLSASCTMETCWLRMPSFAEVGTRLRKRFDGAVKVIAMNDGTHFMPEGSTIKNATRRDLIYTENSPDFCQPNNATGSLGTQGRECNNTSYGEDGCDILCCNRGKDKKVVTVTSSCNCTFMWCCKVTCMECKRQKEEYTCL